jgi:hypothetical protein
MAMTERRRLIGIAYRLLAPVVGADAIARRLVAFAPAAAGQTVTEATVNGQPGLVTQQDGVTVTVVAFDVVGGQITRIWAVRNPEKLRSWTAA